MTKRKVQAKRRPTKEQVDTIEDKSVEITEEQIEAARQQVRQKAATELVILKQKYADAEVARTMAEIERDQLSAQLRTAQATIEEMAKRLRGEDKKEDEK